MRPLILKLKSVFILYVLGLFMPSLIHGQGSIYLSNTNQNVTVNSSGIDFGIGFVTGTNPSGYMLNTVTVLFADNDTPILTSAALYDYSVLTSFQNVQEIGGADYYTYTPSSPLLLAANTPYAILVFTDDPEISINFSYTASSTITSVDGWSVPGLGESEIPLFAITAMPVSPAPEPSVTSLASTSIFVFIMLQIKSRGLKSKSKF